MKLIDCVKDAWKAFCRDDWNILVRFGIVTKASRDAWWEKYGGRVREVGEEMKILHGKKDIA